MAKTIDKAALVSQIRVSLERELAILRESAKSAREGATHPDAKPENDKDTRALEAGYLAGAQAGRVSALQKTIAELEFFVLREFRKGDPIAVSALVEVDVDGATVSYFIASAGGGLKLNVDGAAVLVVTPEAPLGEALVSKRAGDVFELRAGGKLREYEILAVR